MLLTVHSHQTSAEGAEMTLSSTLQVGFVLHDGKDASRLCNILSTIISPFEGGVSLLEDGNVLPFDDKFPVQSLDCCGVCHGQNCTATRTLCICSQ